MALLIPVHVAVAYNYGSAGTQYPVIAGNGDMTLPETVQVAALRHEYGHVNGWRHEP